MLLSLTRIDHFDHLLQQQYVSVVQALLRGADYQPLQVLDPIIATQVHVSLYHQVISCTFSLFVNDLVSLVLMRG